MRYALQRAGAAEMPARVKTTEKLPRADAPKSFAAKNRRVRVGAYVCGTLQPREMKVSVERGIFCGRASICEAAAYEISHMRVVPRKSVYKTFFVLRFPVFIGSRRKRFFIYRGPAEKKYQKFGDKIIRR